jgi:hypothetical protein
MSMNRRRQIPARDKRDRGFESFFLQQGVTCELDFGRDATLLNWLETARRPTNTERSGETDPSPLRPFERLQPWQDNWKLVGSFEPDIANGIM